MTTKPIVQELVEALEVFAEHPVLASFPNAKAETQAPVSHWNNLLTFADFRRARSVLTRARSEMAGGDGGMTLEMIEAGVASLSSDDSRCAVEVAIDCYNAMTAAVEAGRTA